jgi:hypothetical protein
MTDVNLGGYNLVTAPSGGANWQFKFCLSLNVFSTWGRKLSISRVPAKYPTRSVIIGAEW